MSNKKVIIIHLIVEFIEKILLYKICYFPEPYARSKNKITFELYLPNYATKPDLKNAKGVDISDFAKKADLTSLKSDIDKSDIGKLQTTPVD